MKIIPSLLISLVSVSGVFVSGELQAQQPELMPVTWENYNEWYYKTTEPYKGWRYIVLHHSATDAGSVSAFHKYHTRQGYGGIAYHFVIGNGHGMQDGEVQPTFRWQQQISGTHVSINSWQHNIFGIGICLVGNLEKAPATEAQLNSLRKLVRQLQRAYKIEDKNVYGHQHVPYDEVAGKKETTACPGKHLDLKEIKPSL